MKNADIETATRNFKELRETLYQLEFIFLRICEQQTDFEERVNMLEGKKPRRIPDHIKA